MTKVRQEKIDRISETIPEQEIITGGNSGDVLVLGWGSTYGSIKTAVKQVNVDGCKVSQVHLKYINPFPSNLGEIIQSFNKVLIPEINNGQLIKIIKDKYLVDAIGFNKIQGMPIYASEIKQKVLDIINE